MPHSTPHMVQFIGKHGRMPTADNHETIVCPLFDCRLTAHGEEAHVKVRGDSYTYQVEQKTYMAILTMMQEFSTVLIA